MNNDIMLCSRCNEEFDAEDHLPYTSTCGHYLCATCLKLHAPLLCPHCGEAEFDNTSKPNNIAKMLFIQAEQDMELISELLENVNELKMDLDQSLPRKNGSPPPSSTSPTDDLPPPASPPRARRPSLGDPPTYFETMASGNRVEGSRQAAPLPSKRPVNQAQSGRPTRSSNVITVENVNPDWSIPDINERFGYFGWIVDRYQHFNSEKKFVSIDIRYENCAVATDVIKVMNNTPNDCGGQLNVHFRARRNQGVERGRPFQKDRTVIVSNWGSNTKEADLREIFSKIGRVIACKRITDRDGRLTGKAFVEFDDPRLAKLAIANMDGKYIDGTKLKLIVEEKIY